MHTVALRVALVDGPSYRPLYKCMEEFERMTGNKVHIAYRGTHPELNRHVKQQFEADGGSYDLISTHTKYAPSQAPFLLSLDPFYAEEELSDFAPSIIQLACVDGQLKSVPRNFDARLLIYRTDRFQELGLAVPQTWEELRAAAERAKAAGYTGFVFPGKESGLFGTFFELLISEGGVLFDEQLQPAFSGEAGVRALRFLKELYQQGLTPPELTDMHYDEVSECFRNGHSMMVTDWPGYYKLMEQPASPVYERYGLSLTPAGSTGRRAVYCGSHSFAVTAASRYPEQAVQLLKFMTSANTQAIDALYGHVPVRASIMQQMKTSRPGALNALRWALLEETMASSVVIPPKFAEYPQTEDILWMALRECLSGKLTEEEALVRAKDEIDKIVSKYASA